VKSADLRMAFYDGKQWILRGSEDGAQDSDQLLLASREGGAEPAAEYPADSPASPDSAAPAEGPRPDSAASHRGFPKKPSPESRHRDTLPLLLANTGGKKGRSRPKKRRKKDAPAPV